MITAERLVLLVVVVCGAVLAGGCNAKRDAALTSLRDPRASLSDRVKALRLLQQHGEDEDAALVARSLGYPSERVRLAAVRALGAMDAAAQLPQVIPLLHDESREVRLAAIRFVGASEHRRAKQFLVPLLEDRSLVIRRATSAALEARKMSKVAQRKALARRMLEDQIRAIGSLNEQVRVTAAEQLGLSGNQAAVDALTRRLRDPAPPVREAAARALGRIGGPEARQALAELARDPDRAFQRVAALGLAELQPPLWEALMPLLEAQAADVRTLALAAIGRSPGGTPPAALRERVCASLRSSDGDTVLAAARAVAAYEQLACTDTVSEVLQQVTEVIAAERATAAVVGQMLELFDRVAALSCRRCLRAMFQLMTKSYETYRDDAMKWIPTERWAELDQESAPVPLDEKPPKAAGREVALSWLLSRYPTRDNAMDGDPLLPPPLEMQQIGELASRLAQRVTEQSLRDEVERWLLVHAGVGQPVIARVAFLDALRVLPPNRSATAPATSAPTSIPASRPDASPRKPKAGSKRPKRREAAPAVVASQPTMAEVLGAALAEDSPALRQAAVGCLVHLPEEGRRRALALLDDPAAPVRDEAVTLLGTLGVEAAVPRLLRELEQNPRPEVIIALGRIGDERALNSIVELLQDDHPITRRATERALVVEALAGFPSSKAIEVLGVELLHPDPVVRLAAAEALGRIGRPEAARVLRGCEEDFYREVRRACQRATDRIGKANDER
jgi:HEAT repeat protein